MQPFIILTATDEIKGILLGYLPEDIILKILKIRDKVMLRESKVYWRTITPKLYLAAFAPWIFNQRKILNLLIKRMNGNLENLKSEQLELKYLKQQNDNLVRF